jgi:hypothetical protein
MKHISIIFNGKVYYFSIHSDETVLSLKIKIKDCLDIPVENQRLLFQGYPMVDENLLDFVPNYSIIYCM